MDALFAILRSINIAAGVLGIVLLLRKYKLYWKYYHTRTKDFWWVLMSWCLAIVLGTSEVLLGWDTNFRVLFTSMALILTLKVIIQPNEVDHPTLTNEF